MVRGIEDLRTPLQTILDLDKELRGTLSGFMMPAFVIDLPGGGGKRLVSTVESYKDGVAVYKAPGLPGVKGTMSYTYYDPKPVNDTTAEELRPEQEFKKDASLPELASPIPQHRPSLPPSERPRQPSSIQNLKLAQTPAATNIRPTALKPEDLSPHHLSVNSFQHSPSAAAP